jgi:hypothetical protein
MVVLGFPKGYSTGCFFAAARRGFFRAFSSLMRTFFCAARGPWRACGVEISGLFRALH